MELFEFESRAKFCSALERLRSLVLSAGFDIWIQWPPDRDVNKEQMGVIMRQILSINVILMVLTFLIAAGAPAA